jgi:hypothetical protein
MFELLAAAPSATSSVTGLESWSVTLIYLAAAATALATLLSVARFRASAHADITAIKLIVIAVLFLVTASIGGCIWIAATVMNPLASHLKEMAIFLGAALAPQLILLFAPTNSYVVPKEFSASNAEESPQDKTDGCP